MTKYLDLTGLQKVINWAKGAFVGYDSKTSQLTYEGGGIDTLRVNSIKSNNILDPKLYASNGELWSISDIQSDCMKSFPYAITDTFSYRRIYTDEPNDTTDNQNKCRCFGIEFDSGSFEQQYMTGLLIRDSYTDRAILINECGISQLNGNYPLDEDEIELYANECWLANGQTYDLTQKADKTDLDAKLNTSDSITNDEITTLFS